MSQHLDNFDDRIIIDIIPINQFSASEPESKTGRLGIVAGGPPKIYPGSQKQNLCFLQLGVVLYHDGSKSEDYDQA